MMGNFTNRPTTGLRIVQMDYQSERLPEILAARKIKDANDHLLKESFTIGEHMQPTFDTDLFGDTVAQTLRDRAVTHGPYPAAAAWADNVQAHLQALPNWKELSSVQRISLQLIAVKIARLGHGNSQHPDHWEDIAGYARLAIPDKEK